MLIYRNLWFLALIFTQSIIIIHKFKLGTSSISKNLYLSSLSAITMATIVATLYFVKLLHFVRGGLSTAVLAFDLIEPYIIYPSVCWVTTLTIWAFHDKELVSGFVGLGGLIFFGVVSFKMQQPNTIPVDSRDFFEKQEKLLCGKHALNNLFGKEVLTQLEINDFCIEVGNEINIKRNEKVFVQSHHCNEEKGHYSSDILKLLIQNKLGCGESGFQVANAYNYIPPLLENIVNLRGLVVGTGKHWFAVRFRWKDHLAVVVDSLNRTETFPVFDDVDSLLAYLKSRNVIAAIGVSTECNPNLNTLFND